MFTAPQGFFSGGLQDGHAQRLQSAILRLHVLHGKGNGRRGCVASVIVMEDGEHGFLGHDGLVDGIVRGGIHPQQRGVKGRKPGNIPGQQADFTQAHISLLPSAAADSQR